MVKYTMGGGRRGGKKKKTLLRSFLQFLARSQQFLAFSTHFRLNERLQMRLHNTQHLLLGIRVLGKRDAPEDALHSRGDELEQFSICPTTNPKQIQQMLCVRGVAIGVRGRRQLNNRRRQNPLELRGKRLPLAANAYTADIHSEVIHELVVGVRLKVDEHLEARVFEDHVPSTDSPPQLTTLGGKDRLQVEHGHCIVQSADGQVHESAYRSRGCGSRSRHCARSPGCTRWCIFRASRFNFLAVIDGLKVHFSKIEMTGRLLSHARSAFIRHVLRRSLRSQDVSRTVGSSILT